VWLNSKEQKLLGPPLSVAKLKEQKLLGPPVSMAKLRGTEDARSTSECGYNLGDRRYSVAATHEAMQT